MYTTSMKTAFVTFTNLSKTQIKWTDYTWVLKRDETQVGYSSYEGCNICSAISIPLFQVSGKFVVSTPIFDKKWRKHISTPIVCKMYSFDPPFLALCSISSQRAVLSIPIQNPTENPPPPTEGWEWARDKFMHQPGVAGYSEKNLTGGVHSRFSIGYPWLRKLWYPWLRKWWALSAKGKDHHGVSSGWSSVWHRSNTGLSSTQYEQIPIILGVWPFWLTPFFFQSITFWRAYG